MTRIPVAIITLVLTAGSMLGQSATAVSSDLRPSISKSLPFRPGESLTYDITVSKFILSGTLGQLTLSVSKSGEESKAGLLELKADVTSKGFFSKLFGLSVKDKYVSTVDSRDFGLISSTKTLDQGKVKKEQKAVIDRSAGRLSYTEKDLASRSTEPKVKDKAAPTWLQDLLSLCFFIRTQPLKEGDVIPVTITDVGEIYNIELVVGKRDDLKVDAGKFTTVMIDAKIFNGRYVRRSGELFIWITDDARRIPVKARIKTSGATATIELKRAKGV